jgi:hypothetical protein
MAHGCMAQTYKQGEPHANAWLMTARQARGCMAHGCKTGGAARECMAHGCKTPPGGDGKRRNVWFRTDVATALEGNGSAHIPPHEPTVAHSTQSSRRPDRLLLSFLRCCRRAALTTKPTEETAPTLTTPLVGAAVGLRKMLQCRDPPAADGCAQTLSMSMIETRLRDEMRPACPETTQHVAFK